MNTASSFFGAFAIIAAGLLISLSLFSFTRADRLSDRRTSVRAMCTNEMFCIPIYNQATSRRAVTVPCNGWTSTDGFDTEDGLIHIGDYFFEPSTNTYISFVSGGMISTSTAVAPKCLAPHYEESSTKPVGMREVHRTGTITFHSCMLDGKRIAVTFSDEGTNPAIMPLDIDTTQRVNCIYAQDIHNESPRGR